MANPSLNGFSFFVQSLSMCASSSFVSSAVLIYNWLASRLLKTPSFTISIVEKLLKVARYSFQKLSYGLLNTLNFRI